MRWALEAWARRKDAKKRDVDYVFKGQNPLTEMYSIFKAEVPLGPCVSDGGFNQELFDRLTSYKTILIAGPAKSHCVNFSVRDLIGKLPSSRHKDVYILEDTMSNLKGEVPKTMGDDFITFCKGKGVKVVNVDVGGGPLPSGFKVLTEGWDDR